MGRADQVLLVLLWQFILRESMPVSAAHLGCYMDEESSRTLNGYDGNSKTNTPSECIKTCYKLGYLFAGVEFTTGCLCGNSLSLERKIVVNLCNYPCPKDASQMCGGYWRVNVHDTGIKRNCIFNGKTYKDSERLPGCLKVYCINGKWLEKGYISPLPECSRCRVYLDPHFRTFDNVFYGYMGVGEHVLTQQGSTIIPNFRISNQFRRCNGVASCVGPSTFKDSANTTIKIATRGYNSEIYTLLVNGVEYEIPDGSTPRLVKEGSIEHPVFAWRHGSNCIRLLGSNKLSFQQCSSNSVEIWAPNDLYDSLNGLCGYYDGNKNNDFRGRNGFEYGLSRNPKVGFPSSWKVSLLSTGTNGNVTVEGGDCTIDNTTVTEYLLGKCNETIGAAGNGMVQEERDNLLDDCFFDVCSILKSSSGDTEVINQWLGNVKSTAVEFIEITKNTTDNDVLPEDPSTSTTEETTLPPMSTTEETTLLPTSTTEETTLPPISTTEETTLLPTSTTEETTLPTTSTTDETTLPPTSMTEETTLPPTFTTEETTLFPTSTTEETTLPTTEETTLPPTSMTEETTLPSTSTTEETTLPTTSTTEETTLPPTSTTDDEDATKDQLSEFDFEQIRRLLQELLAALGNNN